MRGFTLLLLVATLVATSTTYAKAKTTDELINDVEDLLNKAPEGAKPAQAAPAPKAKPTLKVKAKAAAKQAAAAALGAALLIPTPALAARSGGRAGGGGMRGGGMRGGGYSRSYSRGGGGYSRGATRMYASPMVKLSVEIERYAARRHRADVMETARTSTTRFPRR